MLKKTGIALDIITVLLNTAVIIMIIKNRLNSAANEENIDEITS